MIELDRVCKTFRDGTRAVDDVSITVPEGRTLCLIGTSGCGKTTTMRMINRLTEPSAGRIRVGGTLVTDLDPVQLRRGIGYVVQKGGLFPHLNVFENLALLPRRTGWAERDIERRVLELLDLVRLQPDLIRHRYPDELSGGQQQRVGVARALVLDPPVILLDEPFGALDPLTRSEMQAEFLRLKLELGKTMVFVTHDLAEAFRLGDVVTLMDGGRVIQTAPPAELLSRPASQFVIQFLQSHDSRADLSQRSVEDALITDPPTMDPAEVDRTLSDSTLRERTLRTMEDNGLHVLYVVDISRVLHGMVSREDLAKGSARMQAAPVPASRSDSLPGVVDRMLACRLASYPVLDGDGKFAGAVTRRALIRVLGGHGAGIEQELA